MNEQPKISINFLAANRKKVFLVSEVYRLLQEFRPFHEIKSIVKGHRNYINKNSDDEFNVIYKLGLDRFASNLQFTKEFYLQQSIFRYEKEIYRLYNDKDPETKFSSLSMCLDTMRDVESLLGFRTNIIKVRINTLIVTRKDKLNNPNTYKSLEKLSLESKIDFLNLLEKSKLSELESIKLIEKRESLSKDSVSSEYGYTKFELIEQYEQGKEDNMIEMVNLHSLTKKIQINHLGNEV